MPTDDSTTRLMKAGIATGVMLVVGWFFAPSLSNWQDRLFARRLLKKISASNDRSVNVPLRQLSSLGEPALESLIIAAASERASVATVARKIIDEKLTAIALQSTQALPKGQDTKFVDSTVAIANALAVHIHDFGPSGKQWAQRLALELIELTAKLPARQTHALLEKAERVLAAIPPRGPVMRTLIPSSQPRQNSSYARLPTLEPKLESLTSASERSLAPLARIELETPNAPVPNNPSLSLDTKPPTSQLDWFPRSHSDTSVPNSEFQSVTKQSRLEPVTKPTQPTTKNPVVNVPTPRDMATQAARLRQVSTENLFARLNSATLFEAGVIRLVLGERGFGNEEILLRGKLSTPVVSDRLRFIEEVSHLPASSARRILRWLLEDESAEVRLRALTALATAQAPDLRELAQELAVRDEDSRVANLASRLLNEKR